MKGRKPQPIALRIARGNPGKRRIDTSTLQPATLAPDPPPHFTGEALAEWQRVTTELLALGVIARIDRPALAAFCSAWARFVEADRQVRELGPIVKSPSGFPIQNPHLAVLNKATEQITKLCAEFGFTPSSRSRIHPATAQAPDAFDAFLAESNPLARVGGE